MSHEIKTIPFSPLLYARVGGMLYLLIILTGLFSELFVRGNLIVSGNTSATAHNIIASPMLWRLGIMSDLVMHLCDVPLMVIFYVLLRPVNRHLALMALLYTLIQTAVMVALKINLFEALFLLGDDQYLKSFESSQLDALAYTFLRQDGLGFGIGLLFFGFACLTNGYLIRKSCFLPNVIGWLMQMGGLCYIVSNTMLILGQKFPGATAIFVILPSFIAEFSLCLWLIFKGIDLSKWNEAVHPDRLAW